MSEMKLLGGRESLLLTVLNWWIAALKDHHFLEGFKNQLFKN